jgi:hypothetical protein
MVFFGPGIFEWARVLDVNQLHFQRVNLSKVRLRNAQIKNIEFTDVRWAVVRNVFGMKKREAVYDEISRSKDADWSDVERLYRQLKQNHEDKRDFERAGQFHVGEKEMRLRNLATSRSLRILLALYKLTSGYGESYLLPFCWLVGLVAFVSTMGILEGLWEEDWRRAGLYTVRTILHLSGDDLKQHSLLFGLSSTMASALGPLFIAMAIFGMRQRLKR